MRTLPILNAALGGCVVLAACGDVNGLLPAIYPNRTDTVSVYALTGTPVSTPSAYYILGRQVVRTDQSPAFDFAFDIDSLGRGVLLPTGALKLGLQSGAQLSAVQFDSLKLAPSSGYKSHNYFAKLHVLAIDTSSAPGGRRIDLEVLTNINCGYRGLEPGLPKQ